MGAFCSRYIIEMGQVPHLLLACGLEYGFDELQNCRQRDRPRLAPHFARVRGRLRPVRVDLGQRCGRIREPYPVRRRQHWIVLCQVIAPDLAHFFRDVNKVDAAHHGGHEIDHTKSAIRGVLSEGRGPKSQKPDLSWT